mmetsp:Transcript_34207/g.78980  ORF Transcript_34207/g.78980 Transcript_34207/m.78980 type:complete len:205 (+) Transcript_34207:1570-2184(+)
MSSTPPPSFTRRRTFSRTVLGLRLALRLGRFFWGVRFLRRGLPASRPYVRIVSAVPSGNRLGRETPHRHRRGRSRLPQRPSVQPVVTGDGFGGVLRLAGQIDPVSLSVSEIGVFVVVGGSDIPGRGARRRLEQLGGGGLLGEFLGNSVLGIPVPAEAEFFEGVGAGAQHVAAFFSDHGGQSARGEVARNHRRHDGHARDGQQGR